MKAKSLTMRIIVAALALEGLIIVLAFGRTVNAQTIERNSSGHSFTSAWESTAYIDGTHKLVYGFNTLFIDEDYSWCNKQYSQAYVTNANGTFRAKAAYWSNDWSKIEVRHAGNYIVYGAIGVG